MRTTSGKKTARNVTFIDLRCGASLKRYSPQKCGERVQLDGEQKSGRLRCVTIKLVSRLRWQMKPASFSKSLNGGGGFK